MKRICVFCGSAAGDDSRYLGAAHDFGRALAEEGLGLVFGGSRMGLMGRVATAATEAGGNVIGVIPGVLMNREVPFQEIDELRIVRSMHERKTEMAELADAFVALPGGLGTLEGFTELLTWGQLGLHRKPCGLLNVSGFFDHLIEFYDHAVKEGFVSRTNREMIIVEDSPDALLERLRDYTPPPVPRWIDSQET